MEQLQQTKRNPMASAALMLGLFAIGLAFIIPVYGLFCGCLSILFANLSRGSGLKMPDKALAGLITSIFAIVIALLLSVAALYLQQFLAQRFGAEALQDPANLQKILDEFMRSYMNEFQTGGNGL
ncbi:MAG: hypothetical protein HFI19_14905 [Lachnospiraceae bacterium]|jgi:hypothetical protein|uniref:hypothetical protein n=1 Tax=Candidatus Merdisoma sp. JLR.KK006 TaxID=3112626 RepID=UPI002FF0A935|nr:hypothetical protein [Lachnospiraceae bacterium]